jgi:hypothetical protein
MISSLLKALRAVPDHRAANTIHPLASILTMAVCAMLCGRTSVLSITEWGETYGKRLAKVLQFKRPYTPCNTTLHYVFRDLDVDAFQRAVSTWLQARTPKQARAELEAVLGKEAMSLDGKTLRGSQDGPDVPAVALVAAFLHQNGQVLDQQRISDGDELQAVRTLLQRLPLDHRIVTGDALHTQRDVTTTILEKKGPTSRRSRAINPPSKPKSRQNLRTLRPSLPT